MPLWGAKAPSPPLEPLVTSEQCCKLVILLYGEDLGAAMAGGESL